MDSFFFVTLKGQSDESKMPGPAPLFTYSEEPDLPRGTCLLLKWDFALVFLRDRAVPDSLQEAS